MKKTLYAVGTGTFLVVFPAASFLFGMVIHESSHAIICLSLGLPYSWSLTQVVYLTSSDPLVNTVVRLAGGAGQALFSFASFCLVTLFEKRIQRSFLIESQRALGLGVVFGIEIALLTVAFHGIANGIWEGLFYPHYSQNYNNNLWTAVILLPSLLPSSYIVFQRCKLVTTPE